MKNNHAGLLIGLIFLMSCDQPDRTRVWSVHLFGTAIQDIDVYENVVWLATDEGLIRATAGDTTIYSSVNSPLQTFNIRTVEVDRQANVWFGDGNQGLVVFDGMTWYRYRSDNSPLPSNSVADILFEDSVTWLAVGPNLVCFAPSDTTVYTSENSPLPGSPLVALEKGANDDLWIATFGGGLVKKSGTQWSVFTTSNSSIRNNSIFDVVYDGKGKLWVGEGGGLNLYENGAWTNYNSLNSSLPQNDVTALAIESNGTLWMGMYEGGIASLNQGRWKTYDTANSLVPSMRVLSLHRDHKGVIRVGTPLGLAVLK